MSAAEALPAQAELSYVPHDQLLISPLNPRKHARSEAELAELASSIEEKGVLQNLIVRPHPHEATRYEIAAGEGRWSAVHKLVTEGKASSDYLMPVAIRQLTDEQMIEVGLIENLQREDLHPLDEGRAYLALYEAKAKNGGKKAAATALHDLAAKVHRTKRYIEKRMALARNLSSDAQRLFTADAISLAVAQTLAAAPAKDQEGALSRFQNDDGTYDADELKQATPRDLQNDITNKWRPMREALFNAALYKGQIEEINGVEFAVDGKAFDALQKKAAADLTVNYRQLAKEGEVAFFETKEWFRANDYTQTDDPAAGVILVKTHGGRFALYRGLVKTKETLEQEEAQRQYRERSSKAEKRSRDRAPPEPPKPDPRFKVVAKFIAENPAAAMAAEIAHQLIGGTQLDWLGTRAGWGTTTESVRKALRELNGEALPKDAGELMTWLLDQKITALAPAWAAMRAGDVKVHRATLRSPGPAAKALFAHCDAQLPEASAAKKDSKAPKTASKSKPSKKGKRK